ncbi:hypothetical protein CNECB9_4760006 [Cupriavidus necator]|uniref:Uncharacterized protein n=1 Tax=Cupriavidus necator TaxID=106590 RepID=A0A1K0JH15_CUPNE|nr:hypothetical protein CNECB9_4760006 [Cupriavidus necator]
MASLCPDLGLGRAAAPRFVQAEAIDVGGELGFFDQAFPSNQDCFYWEGPVMDLVFGGLRSIGQALSCFEDWDKGHPGKYRFQVGEGRGCMHGLFPN